jgi:hypothetical protein
MIDDLIAIAEELSKREARRPKRASLNRAVSTAYYALFHALAELCARELIGNYRPWKPFRLIYRSLDHAGTRRVFERAAGTAESSAPVLDIGRAFILLQSERHKADYDPEYAPMREDTLELVERAREGVASIRALGASDRKLLAALLVSRIR